MAICMIRLMPGKEAEEVSITQHAIIELNVSVIGQR